MKLVANSEGLLTMSEHEIDAVRRLEAVAMNCEQVDIETSHLLHAGMYARTIRIPAGVMLTGALIKVPTVVTVNGFVTVYTGQGTLFLQGYNVIPASAGRKQAFLTHSETYITMQFPTNATTVEEAEAEFTDEGDLLMSHRHQNKTLITGE